MGAENLAPPGFDDRIVQPVASRYTDYHSYYSRLNGKNILYKLWKQQVEYSSLLERVAVLLGSYRRFEVTTTLRNFSNCSHNDTASDPRATKS